MDCMCNRKLTKISLYCINTIILVSVLLCALVCELTAPLLFQVGGIILTAVSSWGVRFDSNIRQGLPPSSIIPILIAGIFLMFLALFGTIGGCFNHSVSLVLLL